jgi:hypothetical protein
MLNGRRDRNSAARCVGAGRRQPVTLSTDRLTSSKSDMTLLSRRRLAANTLYFDLPLFASMKRAVSLLRCVQCPSPLILVLSWEPAANSALAGIVANGLADSHACLLA